VHPQRKTRSYSRDTSRGKTLGPCGLLERNPWHALDLQKLETFRVLAKAGGFTRAGLQLGYSQSTITFHIKTLEHEFGAVLFERARFSRDVTLTEAGYSALQYAEQILGLAQEAKTVVKGIGEKSASQVS
jgi:DNA-binding transcriptional LysR family regulator